jgi:uncharacterized protein YjeT (DUF2065 family)
MEKIIWLAVGLVLVIEGFLPPHGANDGAAG